MYPNGSWYDGRFLYGLRHGYGTLYVPYDDITLCGLWKLDRFHFGMACHGEQTRFGFGDELYKGVLLNRKSNVFLFYSRKKRKSKKYKHNDVKYTPVFMRK